MDNTFKPLLMQEALHSRGLYTGELDNLWGPKSKAALAEFLRSIRKGSPAWTWFGFIEGDDLVFRNVWATAFGGDSDAGDSGETASGYDTKGHPELLGVALPMAGYGIGSLTGSPIPRMPYGIKRDGSDNPDGAHVVVTSLEGKETPPMPVIDLGPSRTTGNAIDLSVAAAKLFYPQATANNFKMKVNYRIIGGKKWT